MGDEFKHTINLGKLDYNGNGRRNCKVTIDVEIKPAQRVAPYLTIDLTPVPEGAVRLSISGSIWNPRETDIYTGGQCREEIAKLFPSDKRVKRLCAIWEQYHLNDMCAGTRVQQMTVKNMPAVVYPVSHYDAACEYLKARGLLEVPYPDGRYTPEDGLGRSKPATYKYGSAWLFNPIPQEILDEIKALCGEPAAKSEAPAVEEVDDSLSAFCDKYGISMIAKLVDKRPGKEEDNFPGARHYRCRFYCVTNDRYFSTHFSKGSALVDQPTAEEALGCLISDSRGIEGVSFEDWCGEFGFDSNSRKDEKVFKTWSEQAGKLKVFLGKPVYDELMSAELV